MNKPLTEKQLMCLLAQGALVIEAVEEIRKRRREAQADDCLIARWREKVDDLGVEIRRLQKEKEQVHKDVEDLEKAAKEDEDWYIAAPTGVRMVWCNLMRSSGVDENRWFGP